MQATMNIKIKFREGFRPFAPSVLYEKVNDFFEIEKPSPYMLLTTDVKKERRIPMTDEEHKKWGIEKLNVVRSNICLLYTSPSPRDRTRYRMPSSACKKNDIHKRI